MTEIPLNLLTKAKSYVFTMQPLQLIRSRTCGPRYRFDSNAPVFFIEQFHLIGLLTEEAGTLELDFAGFGCPDAERNGIVCIEFRGFNSCIGRWSGHTFLLGGEGKLLK